MGVRAKFHIQSIELRPGVGAGGEVKLQAVSRGDRNAEWASATPSGSMTMLIQNEPALAFFTDMLAVSRTTGKYPEVFIDITPSSDGYPGDGHAFVESTVSEGHYLHGKCAECGYGPDDSYGPGQAHPTS
jgi:hypothetical protein